MHKYFHVPYDIVHVHFLRARWEAILDNVEKRLDLSTSGHAHLTSYADQSTTFDQWLTSAEEKHSSMSTIPSTYMYMYIAHTNLPTMLSTWYMYEVISLVTYSAESTLIP